jgi:hypothetical protein
MHLIPLTSEPAPVIVWLEDRGVRTFQVQESPQGRRLDLPALRATVTDDATTSKAVG